MIDHKKYKLSIGAQVRKATGDYWWKGICVSLFNTPEGKERVVVAHPVDKGHVLHIYAPKSLQILVDDEWVTITGE